ncbi:MAG: 4-hydroxy-3-methylbut-2-enyl diphosphate reductase [Bacilli bacterium]|nr:4-hydroxy-3-methylbut-2-enyl diphosphate reductase [Bacilli bacterium]
MEIIVGKTAGFCGGVKLSVDKTKELLNSNSNYYCLGELVHNNEVITELEDKGLKIVNSLDEVDDNSTVIVRAHGIAKEVYEEAERRGINLIDLTCPKVLRIHELVKKDNSLILLFGKIDHPEIIGTISFCNNGIVVDSTDDLDKVISYIKNNNIKEVSVYTQTTYSLDKYNELINYLEERLTDIKLNINNNICDATRTRQSETRELAGKVDLMIIIGGKNSSNTKKLYEIASSITKTYIIETIKDLKDKDINFNKIGIMAGASTPKSSIDECINFLKG